MSKRPLEDYLVEDYSVEDYPVRALAHAAGAKVEYWTAKSKRPKMEEEEPLGKLCFDKKKNQLPPTQEAAHIQAKARKLTRRGGGGGDGDKEPCACCRRIIF